MSTCSLPESYDCPINLAYTHWPRCWGVWNAAKHICCLEIKLRWASASSTRLRLTSSPASLTVIPQARQSHLELAPSTRIMRLPGRFRCLNTSCCVFSPANTSMHASVAGWNSVSLENSHELKIEKTLEAMELGMMWERMDNLHRPWRQNLGNNLCSSHRAMVPKSDRTVPVGPASHGYYPAGHRARPDLRRYCSIVSVV